MTSSKPPNQQGRIPKVNWESAMKSINAYLLALTLCFAGVATADHKPGHPPPTEGGTDLSDLSCIEGQTVAFVGGVWVCADFPAGLTGLERVQADFPANSGTLSTIATQEVFADCPDGKKVVGGGYTFFYGGPTVPIRDNFPTLDLSSWLVAATNPASTPWRLSAVAVCADAE
jgi:hypothetical protein